LLNTTIPQDAAGNLQIDDVNLAEETGGDVYLLINKIQNDIAQHEALVERIQKRDAEYEVMKKAYEQKLSVLQSQMAQFQIERDLAMSRMQAGNKAKAKTKFDEEKRHLDTQIAEYKRKLGENSRMQINNRSRSDMLTRELQATIEALKRNFY
jgi:septal ring factor EnvC (AmiA/AmiB activator)